MKTVVGYTGGEKADANYSAVSAHKTKHREAIEVTYDPAVTTFEKLLDVYWRNINPTQADGQFHDRGLSYQTAIYFANEEEKKAAESSKEALGKSGKFDQPIAVEILPAETFLSGRRLPPKVLRKESGRVSGLPCRLRPRGISEKNLGRGRGALSKH